MDASESEPSRSSGQTNHSKGGVWGIPPWSVAVFGLVGSIAFLLWTAGLEQDRAWARFRQTAGDRLIVVETGILKNIDQMLSLSAFFESSDSVGRPEFETFVRPFLARNKGVQALSWAPRIVGADRNIFEREAERELESGFQITELGSDRQPIRAMARNEYFPVDFIEPLVGNERALGYDLSSDSSRSATLVKARDSGRPTVTGRVTLVQETGRQFGYLIASPVYRRGVAPTTGLMRRESLRGFVTGVFRIGDQVEALLGSLSAGGVDIYLFDDSSPVDSSYLYHHLSAGPESVDTPQVVLRAEIMARQHVSDTVTLGDRTWQLVAVPSYGAFRARLWPPLAGSGGLLAFSLLLAFYLRSLQLRSAKTEEILEEQTGDLALADSRLRAIVDTAVEGIVTTDSRGTIEYVNPSAEKMFGSTAEELIGQDVGNLAPPEVRETYRENITEFVRSGRGTTSGMTRELIGYRKDGSSFPIELGVSVWMAGESLMLTGVARDVTERKVAEQRILETTRLRTHFVSVVSHELRTPLTAIAEGVNLVLDGAAGEILPGQREILSISQRNIDRLSRLTNRVLDIQKLEAGGLPLHLRSSDLNELIREAWGNFHRKARMAGLELTLALDEDLEEIECDPDYVVQVVSNLLDNALKFTTGSTVRVTTQRDEFHARVIVEDEGDGIPREDLPKLFKPFSQLSQGDQNSGSSGTGLGLVICKMMVERHGGSIGVDSTIGGTTRFYFTLPYDFASHRGTGQ